MSIQLDEAKIELIVNHCVEAMLIATEQGYIFDSVTLAPYSGIVDPGDGDGVHYYLWAKDGEGVKHLVRMECFGMERHDLVPKEEALAALKPLQDDVDNGKYNMDSPNYRAKQESTT